MIGIEPKSVQAVALRATLKSWTITHRETVHRSCRPGRGLRTSGGSGRAAVRSGSLGALLGHAGKARWAEAGLLAVHIGGYLTAVFVVLSPPQAVVFLVVQQGLFGIYMGSSFAPNHKGMPVVGEDEKVDFLRRQVLTSRNIRGSMLTDLALGGLNYQIEHHLFPSMPRPSLRHAQAPVQAFCAQRGIP